MDKGRNELRRVVKFLSEATDYSSADRARREISRLDRPRR